MAIGVLPCAFTEAQNYMYENYHTYMYNSGYSLGTSSVVSKLAASPYNSSPESQYSDVALMGGRNGRERSYRERTWWEEICIVTSDLGRIGLGFWSGGCQARLTQRGRG